MEHIKFKEMIQLALLNELNDDELNSLHDHLINCSECQAEYDSLSEYHSLLAKKETGSVDNQMLEDARQQLRNAIKYELARQGLLEKSINIVKKFLWLYKVPALAGAFSLCAGLFIGYVFFYNGSSNLGSLTGNNSLQGGNTLITNVRFSNENNNGGEIEFTFDAVKQVTMKGKLSDPNVQKILAEALVNEKNPGTRIETANALAQHINDKAKPDPKVKSALISALKSDVNPRVRLEALKALLYMPFDGAVNDALLYVLQRDNNSGMRVAAINGLASAKSNGLQIDRQTLNVLNQKIKNDDNEYVRMRAASLINGGKIQ